MDESQSPADLVIVAGARKAGTSWLFEAAASDARFRVPTIRKELGFFDEHYHRGAAWYREQFRAGDGIALDCSPAYFANPDVPKRVAADAPNARVLFVLRDPMARLVSDFHHVWRRGDLPGDVALGEAARRMPSLADESHYATHLQRWLDQPVAEFGVLFYDDLAADPQRFYDAFCAAAGLVPRPLPEARLEAVFERSEARSRAAMRVVMAGSRFLHRRNLSWVTRPFSRSRMVRSVFEREPAPEGADVLDGYDDLAALLAADTARLRALLAGETRLRCFGQVPAWCQPDA